MPAFSDSAVLSISCFQHQCSAVGHQSPHVAVTGKAVSSKMGFLVCSILIFEESNHCRALPEEPLLHYCWLVSGCKIQQESSISNHSESTWVPYESFRDLPWWSFPSGVAALWRSCLLFQSWLLFQSSQHHHAWKPLSQEWHFCCDGAC